MGWRPFDANAVSGFNACGVSRYGARFNGCAVSSLNGLAPVSGLMFKGSKTECHPELVSGSDSGFVSVFQGLRRFRFEWADAV